MRGRMPTIKDALISLLLIAAHAPHVFIAAKTPHARARFQEALEMNNDRSSSFEREAETHVLQETSSSSGRATDQAGAANSNQSGLKKYPDRPLAAIPRQAVSLRYIVEHRSALNGKTITVRGFVARALWPATENVSSGEQSMANPQPRIFLADSLRKGRDKNYEVMVLVREDDNRYLVGQKVKLKVRVDSGQAAVVLRKVS